MHPLEQSVERLAASAALGRVAQALDKMVRPVLDPAPVRTALSGSWLGHRLHPALVLGPLAAFLSAAVLDRAGDEAGQRAADRLLRLGLLAVGPTAAAGMSDWLHEGERARRVGVAHAASNILATGLAAGAVLARAAGNPQLARTQTRCAAAVLGVGGYLGGHMSYVYGTGVARTAFLEPPGDWTRVAALDDLADGRPRRVDAGGFPIFLSARQGRVHALADQCNHLGCSLAEHASSFDGESVTCGCHGSRFRVADGSVLAGPAASSQPVLDTRVRDGVVEVRKAQRDAGAGTGRVVSLTDRLKEKGAQWRG